MRLYANSLLICVLLSCSYVVYHQQDICCQGVSSSCSNQCASPSTSLWATSIRRRKNAVSYLFMTSFSILRSPLLHRGSACTPYSTTTFKWQIKIEWLSCYSIYKTTKSRSLIFLLWSVGAKGEQWWNNLHFFHLCNKVDEDLLGGQVIIFSS